MAVSANSLAALVPFPKGQSGNPGGRKKSRLNQWAKFAEGIPFEVLDPATGEPFRDLETGEFLNRDDMVMQATFRCAVDIRRNDCTRAQLAWNAYVRGTPKTTAKMEGDAAGGASQMGAARVVTYRIPDNGRGPRADDPNVKPPTSQASGPMPAVPVSDNASGGGSNG